MKRETAVGISTAMTGESPPEGEVPPVISDAIGELANIVAGRAISQINDMGNDFSLLPPLIVTGRGLQTVIPRIETLRIPVTTPHGVVMVNVALKTR